MSNLILLIHDDTDLSALPTAAASILAHGYKGVWILVSPAIAADQAAAASKFDAEIADLLKAEKAAAERGDYVGAESHKLARQGKELERGTALAGAWKAVPEDARQVAYRTKLDPLLSVIKSRVSVKVDVLQDHYDRAQWLTALQGLSGVWFKPMLPGGFAVSWPGAIPTPTRVENNADIATLAKKMPVPSVPNAGEELTALLTPGTFPKGAGNAVKQTRAEQLSGLRTFALYAEAKKAGVEHKGRKKKDIVAAIIAAEKERELAAM